MKMRAITVMHGFTANIGNYNSTRFELSMTADVEEGESAEDARAALDKEVAAYVAGKRRALHQYLKSKANEGGE